MQNLGLLSSIIGDIFFTNSSFAIFVKEHHYLLKLLLKRLFGCLGISVKYIVYLHLKDTRLEKGTWHFTQIGKGIIDYQGIFKILRKSPQKIPMSIELPLRLEMKEGEAPIKTKSPLDIGQINKIVSDSLSYVRRLGNLSDYQS